MKNSYRVTHGLNRLARLIAGSFALLFFCEMAWAIPARVIFIRHAEKMDKSSKNGEVRVRGCDRAYALPSFFTQVDKDGHPTHVDKGGHPFEKPVAIFATKPSEDYQAIRPAQTAVPTAFQFQVALIVSHPKNDVAGLASEVMTNMNYNGKTVLVVWEHKMIPELARGFGLLKSTKQLKWPGAVFDEAWVLDYDTATGNVRDFQIVPENVLPLDNPNGGPAWVDSREIQDSDPAFQAAMQSTPALSAIAKTCQNNDELNRTLKTLLPGFEFPSEKKVDSISSVAIPQSQKPVSPAPPQ